MPASPSGLSLSLTPTMKEWRGGLHSSTDDYVFWRVELTDSAAAATLPIKDKTFVKSLLSKYNCALDEYVDKRRYQLSEMHSEHSNLAKAFQGAYPKLFEMFSQGSPHLDDLSRDIQILPPMNPGSEDETGRFRLSIPIPLSWLLEDYEYDDCDRQIE